MVKVRGSVRRLRGTYLGHCLERQGVAGPGQVYNPLAQFGLGQINSLGTAFADE